MATDFASITQQPFLWGQLPIIVGVMFLGRILWTNYWQKNFPTWYFGTFKDKSVQTNIIQSSYYILLLTICVGYGEWMAWGASWRTNYDECFIGYPHFIEYELQFFYTLEISFYIYQFLLHFVEERKKDFAAMLIHHVSTIIVILTSGLAFCHRGGSVICLTFDIVDIFLELAKIWNRSGKWLPAGISFVTFVALWMYNRMYTFPMYILPACWWGTELAGQDIPYHHISRMILLIIGLLQCYWSIFIIKKLISLLTQGARTDDVDPREKKDD